MSAFRTRIRVFTEDERGRRPYVAQADTEHPRERKMSDYERQRQRHLARALTLAPALIDRLDWSADQLAVHRVERLRELVGYAIGSSPWHRERLDGVDLARLDEASLRELPPMT